MECLPFNVSIVSIASTSQLSTCHWDLVWLSRREGCCADKDAVDMSSIACSQSFTVSNETCRLENSFFIPQSHRPYKTLQVHKTIARLQT